MGSGSTCRWYDVADTEAFDDTERRIRVEMYGERFDELDVSYRQQSPSPGIVLEERGSDVWLKVDLAEHDGRVRLRGRWSDSEERERVRERKDEVAELLQRDAARLDLPTELDGEELHGYLTGAFDRYDEAVVSGPRQLRGETLATQYRSGDGDLRIWVQEDRSYDGIVLEGTDGSDARYERFQDCLTGALGDLNLLGI